MCQICLIPSDANLLLQIQEPPNPSVDLNEIQHGIEDLELRMNQRAALREHLRELDLQINQRHAVIARALRNPAPPAARPQRVPPVSIKCGVPSTD